ncbi:MAG TPA: hypothetical protein PLK22_02395 [Candidatus Paceibacterota bacterium]|nr:hypothetical protein [Candidatus Paceibacterota bacterium]
MKLKLRINLITGTIMVLVALLYDGVQALIDFISVGTIGWLTNPLISFWSFLTFFFWFKLKGLSFMRPNKALTMGGSYFLEVVPLLNSLPTITLGVVIMLGITYAEDVAGIISPEAAKALGVALGNFKKGDFTNSL